MKSLIVLLLIILAAAAGWLSSRPFSGIASVAVGWLVGVTIFSISVVVLVQQKVARNNHDTMTWKQVAMLWCGFVLVLVVPVVAGTWAARSWPWFGAALGWSLFGTMICAMSYVLGRIPGALNAAKKPDQPVRQALRWWLEWHLFIALPILVLGLIDQRWGRNVTVTAIYTWLIVLFFIRKPLGRWLDRKLLRSS